MRAWLFQDHRQRKKHGDRAPWSVGWLDPEGRRRSKRIGAKSLAQKYARRIEGQLAAGIYQNDRRRLWSEFRAEYESRILPRLATKTRESIRTALNHFERIVKPRWITAVTTKSIDAFTARRALDSGRKPGSRVSAATINHDLRHIKAALNVAHDWGHLQVVPKFRWVKELQEIGPVVSAEHFRCMYGACNVAELPRNLSCSPPEWWRALLVFAITSGWRIDEILSFRRVDLDLTSARIRTRAGDNKGRRDDVDFLPHPAIDHIKKIVSFSTLVFEWPHNRRTLDTQFHRIQRAAGIHLPCTRPGEHSCTAACHLYGFHALRRAYATLNTGRMPSAVLQKKMRHRSFTTTLRYIDLADKMEQSSAEVFVPEFLADTANRRSAN